MQGIAEKKAIMKLSCTVWERVFLVSFSLRCTLHDAHSNTITRVFSLLLDFHAQRTCCAHSSPLHNNDFSIHGYRMASSKHRFECDTMFRTRYDFSLTFVASLVKVARAYSHQSRHMTAEAIRDRGNT